jgi:hypothetical protein
LAFQKIGTAVVKFDKSGYAALGWSVVSFGLQAAKNAKDAREFIYSSSALITGVLTRYAEYEKWCRGPEAGEEFDRRMTNVYQAILLYVMVLDDCLKPDRVSQLGRLGRSVYELEDHPIFENKKAINDADAEVEKWVSLLSFRRDITIPQDQTDFLSASYYQHQVSEEY